MRRARAVLAAVLLCIAPMPARARGAPKPPPQIVRAFTDLASGPDRRPGDEPRLDAAGRLHARGLDELATLRLRFTVRF